MQFLEGLKSYTQEELMALIDIKAIIYSRVSTTDQAKHGYSLESQVDRCLQYAKDNFGIQQDECISIIEPGESGDNPDRPGLNHVLFLIEKGIGKKLIMLHPDRMSRYLALQTEVSSRIWSSGCDLEFVEFNVDPTNPESMLMFNIQGSIAQYNKAKILANSKRGRKQMLKNGKIPGIRRVYGYTYDKELDTLVENTEEKQVYLIMVDWLLNRMNGAEMNSSSIARELCKLGIPAPNGQVWYQATVSRILRSEIYTGTFYYGKTEVVQSMGKKKQVPLPSDQWHAISIPSYINRDTYLKIIERLDSLEKKSRGRKSDNYLLKGLCRCGRCGGAVSSGSPSRLKDGMLFYYSCVNKGARKFQVGTGNPVGQCRGRNWRQDIIDEYVWNYLKGLLQEPDKIISDILRQQGEKSRINELSKQIQVTEKEIEQTQKKRIKYQDMYVSDLISHQELEENLKPLNQGLIKLNQQMTIFKQMLAQLNSEFNELEEVKRNVERLNKALHSISIEQKRKLLQIFVQKVVLDENSIEIVTTWTSKSPQSSSPHAYPHSNSITSQVHGGS